MYTHTIKIREEFIDLSTTFHGQLNDKSQQQTAIQLCLDLMIPCRFVSQFTHLLKKNKKHKALNIAQQTGIGHLQRTPNYLSWSSVWCTTPKINYFLLFLLGQKNPCAFNSILLWFKKRKRQKGFPNDIKPEQTAQTGGDNAPSRTLHTGCQA